MPDAVYDSFELTGPRDKSRLVTNMAQTEKKKRSRGDVGKIGFLVALMCYWRLPSLFHLAKKPNSDDTLELLRRLCSRQNATAREAGL